MSVRAMSVYQQARASVASYQTQVMQDKNALNLLAGTTLAENLLPGTLESLPEQMISLVPAGVSSLMFCCVARISRKLNII